MMKGGRVLRMRLNPEDVMSCIDIVQRSNITLSAASLDTVCRLALSGLLEAARIAGTVPRRDGFEYEQMISKYIGARQQGKLIALATVEDEEARRRAFDDTRAVVPVTHASFNAEDEFDKLIIKKGRLLVRSQELDFKYKADPENMSDEEQQERIRLHNELKRVEEQLR